MTNNEIDNKVVEYLDRAAKIAWPGFTLWSQILHHTYTGGILNTIEVAKMIQREEQYQNKDITESPNNRLSMGD